MMVKERLPYDALVALCQRWGVTELSLFGSALRDDFASESDVDLLVSFAPDCRMGLKFFELEAELEELFGRKVDLISRSGLTYTRNSEFRDEVQRTAQVIYAAP